MKLFAIAVFVTIVSYAMTSDIRAQNFRLVLLEPSGGGREPALISQNDLLRYDADQHRLVLGYDAGRRLRDFSVPKAGAPFAVYAGSERIYEGRFFDGFTEPEYRGVAVDIASLKDYSPSILFELDYPPLAPKNPAVDPRNDKRLLNAFRGAGLLYHDVWLDATCVRFHGTGKRRQSFVFEFNVSKVLKGEYRKKTIEFEIYFDAGGTSLLDAVEAGCGSKQAPRFLLKFQRQDKATDPNIWYQGFESLD